ncbi:MAG: signal peptidase II [Pelagibacteraceae bacterium]|nr:signal peptidase II [Pelagibacteraceae bacterium]MCI5079587.1 signal peptidase II [Pelagibacteraceae bacterium]
MSEKIVHFNKKFFISLLLILITFSLDRLSKVYLIQFFIDNKINDYYVNSYLNFTLIWNKGIAFGLLESDTLLYHFISTLIFLIIFFILYLIYKSKNCPEMIFLSIIIGGAVGNFFDRLFYNAVPDFIDIHYNNFHWFTFNVADIFITIAIFLLLIFDIFKLNKENNIKDNEKSL